MISTGVPDPLEVYLLVDLLTGMPARGFFRVP